MKWATLLDGAERYYDRLAKLGKAFRHMQVADCELLPCVAGFLGDPSRRSPVLADLVEFQRKYDSHDWKPPGMGAVLARGA